MERQQSKVPFLITLAGLGVIASAFGLITWLAMGGSELALDQKEKNISNDNVPAVSAVPTQDPPLLGTVKDTPQGLFNYGGSTTWIPVHETTQAMIEETSPDFQLRYTLSSSEPPGSGTGIKMLLNGQLSFSESSRPLKPKEYDAAQQRGFKLEQIPVAIDGIALAVNPKLGMQGLSVTQIQSIYRGEVDNWSELGGPDIPLTAYSRSPESAGTAQYFLDSIVDAEAYGEDVIFVGDTTTGVQKVAKDRGGIYYGSAPEIINQCTIYAVPVASQDQPENFINPFDGIWRTGQNCINQANALNNEGFRSGDYPLTRRLFVIVKVDEGLDEAAGQAYADRLLSPRGQELIEAAGFVSIR